MTHYRIISISLYTEDIDRLEALVQALKQRGHTKANKSQTIRAAVKLLSVELHHVTEDLVRHLLHDEGRAP